MIEPRKLAYLFLGGWLLYVIFLAYSIDGLSQAVHNDGLLTQLLFYLLTQPTTLLIVGGLVYYNPARRIKAFVAGLLISLASDIVASPHCIPNSEAGYASIPSINYLCPDTILVNPLISAIGYNFSWFAVYIIIPILLMVGAVELLGEAGFVNKVRERIRGG